MGDNQANQTPTSDHIEAALDMMRQGARMILSDIPDDSSMASLCLSGDVSKAMYDAFRPEAAQVRVKRDILSECIHTAFRRASDHESAEKAHQAISEMPESEWTNIISFIEHYALEPDTVTEWQANPLSSLPYDTPIVLLLESGNVAQSVWYDEPKESFLRRFNHTPAIGWLDLPLPPAPEKEG